MILMLPRPIRLHRIAVAILVVGLLVLALVGCENPSTSGKTSVVAAFYPLAWATGQVGGSDIGVTDLTQPGVEPHDLELTVRQTARLSAADLVVYEQGFQPSVDSAVQQNTDHGFDVSGTVRLRHDADGADPHFWHDPERMAAYVKVLASRLVDVDPAHAAGYRSRSAALVAKLTALDAAYRRRLSRCRVHTIVVSHDAFGYLSKYGVLVTGIAGLTPGTEPSAKHVEQLQQLIRHDHIGTVFSEVLASPKLSQTLASDLGIDSEVLDPIEGVAKHAPAGTGYLTIMRSNLAALQKANGCS